MFTYTDFFSRNVLKTETSYNYKNNSYNTTLLEWCRSNFD